MAKSKRNGNGKGGAVERPQLLAVSRDEWKTLFVFLKSQFEDVGFLQSLQEGQQEGSLPKGVDLESLRRRVLEADEDAVLLYKI